MAELKIVDICECTCFGQMISSSTQSGIVGTGTVPPLMGLWDHQYMTNSILISTLKMTADFALEISATLLSSKRGGEPRAETASRKKLTHRARGQGLCGLVADFLVTERRCIVLPVRYEFTLYMLCRRK
jgi:hypothetical protein